MASETERRDQLALDRTLLANERTLLAYVRTALALIGGGVGLLAFIDHPVTRVVGAVTAGAGLLLIPVGAWRYLLVRRRLLTP